MSLERFWTDVSRRLATHPATTFTVLLVAPVLAAAAVGSLVRLLVFGTTLLGVDRQAVAAVSVVCAIMATPTVVAIVLALMRGDDGEGGTRGDDQPPTPEGPSGEPEWWPSFERDFAAYAAGQQHVGCGRGRQQRHERRPQVRQHDRPVSHPVLAGRAPRAHRSR